jgi:hypothetical protein
MLAGNATQTALTGKRKARMPKIPAYVSALLAALKFQGAQPELLRALDDAEWRRLLPYCDEMHLTLHLGQVCRDQLPDWVRLRIDRNLSHNTQRLALLETAYAELAHALGSAGAEHLVLKGFAQWPGYARDSRLRMQFDIDLYSPPESISRARDVLLGLGYEPLEGMENVPSDHLPSMIRKTGWKWRGDFFDPEVPHSVDLHFCFWNEKTVRIAPQGLDQFWLRRTVGELHGISFPALDPVDSLAYSSLHALRHLLCGGGLLTFHIYELAWFLHTTTDDTAFWSRWREWHHDSLRRFEAICFALAKDWFNCRLPEDAQNEVDYLPAGVKQWLGTDARTSLYTVFSPNKSTLWLHLSLLQSSRDRRTVLRQALLPTRIPSVDTSYVQHSSEGGQTPRRGVLARRVRHLGYLISRATYHIRILPATLWLGFRWWWGTKTLHEKSPSTTA